MKPTTSSSTTIFKFASIAFFGVSLISLGLFLAIVWKDQSAGVVETKELDLGQDWQTMLPYLEHYRIPIVILPVFVISTDLAIVLGIFSCIREKRFGAAINFFGGIYREIKDLVSTIYNNIKTVLRGLITYFTSKLSNVQIVSLVAAIFFLLVVYY